MENKAKTFKIGCHLSTEGGYRAMGERILSIGGNTFQYFTKNPRGGAFGYGGRYLYPRAEGGG